MVSSIEDIPRSDDWPQIRMDDYILFLWFLCVTTGEKKPHILFISMSFASLQKSWTPIFPRVREGSAVSPSKMRRRGLSAS